MNRFFFFLILTTFQLTVIAKNPIITNKRDNDPHIRIIDGKAWLTASHGKSADNKKCIMEDWWRWSSDDLVKWKLEYTSNPEEIYKIGVIKTGAKLFFNVEGKNLTKIFTWDTSQLLPLKEGGIGLEHMYTRSAIC